MQATATHTRRRSCNARPSANESSAENTNEKDWDQFEACKQCRGGADIDETPDGDLMCQMCRATLPRPVS